MSVARQDPTVTRRYFYSIKDISIGGRCMCNGHANTCDIDPKKTGSTRILVCNCQHNTCGVQCSECCPGFEQKKWRQNTNARPFRCERCNCFGHSNYCIYDEEVDRQALSMDIHGIYDGGGVCQNCQDNTEGINCNKCKPTFFRPYGKHWNETDVCRPCNCDYSYSTGNCQEETGRCECRIEFQPPNCDQCAYGYFDFPNCRECECNLNGTEGYHCEVTDGTCPCKYNFAGQRCKQCADGFYQFPECKSCECSKIGSMSNDCDFETGKCKCLTGYGGDQCGRCEHGYYGYPNCKYCGCDVHGTESEVCDKNNGTCLCRQGFGGPRCDQCLPGYYNYPDCVPCNCSLIGSVSKACDVSGRCACLTNFAGKRCNACKSGYFSYPECLPCNCDIHGSEGISCNSEGQCICLHNFDGQNCEKCKEGFYNFPACEECNCDPAGVIPRFAGCGSVPAGELCQCKERVTGRICDQCKPLYWNLNITNPDGCQMCDCYLDGTVGSLDTCKSKTGQCACKPSVQGRQCKECKDGTFDLYGSNLFGCKDCGCDIGGSRNPVCNKLSGQCNCHSRIAGRTCSNALTTHYFPTLYQFQFEYEDGYTPGGKAVRYQFDESLFPEFSRKGYAVFSNIQNEVINEVNIFKSSVYRMVIRYVNPTGENITATILITSDNPNELDQHAKVLFKPTHRPQFVTVSGTKGEIPSHIVLDPGRYTISIKTDKNILLDYFVLLPAAYYEASILTRKVENPCEIGRLDLCRHYKHPILTEFKPSINPFAVENGSPVKLNEVYADELHLKAIDEHDPIPLITNSQKGLTYLLDVNQTGRYVLVIDYVTDRRHAETYYVNIRVKDEEEDYAIAILYPCLYTTVCRQPVIDQDSREKLFFIDLLDYKAIEVFHENDDFGQVAIKSVTAIPYEQWTVDFINPSSVCIMDQGKCVKTGYRTVPDSKKIEFELDHDFRVSHKLPPYIHDNATKLIYLDSDNATIQIKSKVNTPGSYVILVKYYQPNHPKYKILFRFTTEKQNYDGQILIDHCPSITGCQAVVRPETGYQTFDIDDDFIFTLTNNKHHGVWLDYFFIVPADLYNDVLLHEEQFDQTKKFIQECGQDHFHMQLNASEFCKKAVFSLTADYNDGALPCNCDYEGSNSFECDPFGGQCQCKPNVIGRQCEQCRTGFYGFPDCKHCECPLTALCEKDTGECICPPRVTGEKCDQCQPFTYGFHQIIGCEECNCHPMGVEQGNLQCDLYNGSCKCRRNIEGRTCDRCSNGFYNFPQCEPCRCTEAGTTFEICDKVDETCLCKKNVVGQACDTCAEGTYNLQASNSEGCTKCFCFGKTTRCESAYLRVYNVSMLRNASISTVIFNDAIVDFIRWDIPPEDILLNETTLQADLSRKAQEEGFVYFGVLEYLLNQKNHLTAYGGYLGYTLYYTTGPFGGALYGADIILQSNQTILLHTSYEQPANAQNFHGLVQMVETNFENLDGSVVTRAEFMTVLRDLTAIHIRATYWEQTVISLLSDIYLTIADEDEQNYHLYQELSVEKCNCPPGYIGLSCEECAPGYYRDPDGPYGGYCIPCQCNGHAETCDCFTGVCHNCTHFTFGDYCEKCIEGYHGDATYGTPHDCMICACPRPFDSNNFATGCEISETGTEIYCECKPGYIGARCESCAPGFYGVPETLGDYCKPCECSGNINPSEPGSCDTVTGECLLCLNNTYGRACNLCAPGYYGDAIKLKDCKSCDCEELGTSHCDSYIGKCTCHDNVIGERCDGCDEDHYGYDSGLGCKPCDCGVASFDSQCDDHTGACRCKPGVTGRQCDRCAVDFWNYTEDGCIPCSCNKGFSRGFGCNAETGQCQCLPGVIGEKCDACPRRWVLIKDVGCSVCDVCHHALLNVTDELYAELDPIYTEFQTIGLKYFTARKLDHYDDLVEELVPKVEVLDPKLVNLTPLLNEIQALHQDAKNLGKKILYNEDTAMSNTDKAVQLLKDADSLLNQSKTVSDEVKDTIREVEQLSHSFDISGSTIIDNAVHKAEKILDELSKYQIDLGPSGQLSHRAEKLFSEIEDLAIPVQKQKGQLESLKINIGLFSDKLEDLHNWSVSALNKSNEVFAYNNRNKLAFANSKFDTVENQTREVHQNIDEANKLNINGMLTIGAIERRMDVLSETLDKLQDENKQVDDILPKFEEEYEDVKPLVDAAIDHAYYLKDSADNLALQYANITLNSEKAIQAATAYTNIADAVTDAQESVQEAKSAAQNATDLGKGIIHRSGETNKNASELLSKAIDSLNVVQTDLQPHLNRSAEAVLAIDKLTKASDEKLQNIVSLLNQIPDKSDTSIWQDVYYVAKDVHQDAKTAQEILEPITVNIQDDLEKAKKVTKDVDTAGKSIVQTKTQVDRIDEIVPKLELLINDVNNKQENTRVLANGLRKSIEDLKIQIEAARAIANSIKVGITFESTSLLEVKPPESASLLATTTKISTYFNTTSIDGFLLYLGNENKTTAEGTRRGRGDDFIAIEIENGYPILRMDLGNGPEKIIIEKYVANGQWYQALVDRKGNNVKFSIREELENGTIVSHDVEQSLPGTYSVFNVDKDSKLFVGGYPPDFNMPKEIEFSSFQGQIEDLKIGDEEIGLWNFVDAQHINKGALQRNKMVTQDKPPKGYRFNGSGYVSIDARGFNFKKRSSVFFRFKTSHEITNGLIFYAGKHDDFISIQMIKTEILFQYKIAGHLVNIRSDTSLNDDQWHSVEATRDGRTSLLKVDGQVVHTQEQWAGTDENLKISDEMYFGGYPGHTNHSEIAANFDGCINDVRISGQEIDLSRHLKAIGVRAGCPEKFSSVLSYSPRKVGYLKSPNVTADNNFQINLRLKTKQKESVVFYATNHDQSATVSLTFVDGSIIFSSMQTNISTGKYKYNDGEWHIITATHEAVQLKLSIDDIEVHRSPLIPPTLKIIYGDIYFGGLPQSYRPKKDALPTLAYFVGCISDVTLNGNIINFANTTDKKSANIDGCPDDILDYDVAAVKIYYPGDEIDELGVHHTFTPVLEERFDSGTTIAPTYITSLQPVTSVPAVATTYKYDEVLIPTTGTLKPDIQPPMTTVASTFIPNATVSSPETTLTTKKPGKKRPTYVAVPEPTCVLPLEPNYGNDTSIGYSYGLTVASRLEILGSLRSNKSRRNYEMALQFRTMDPHGILFYAVDNRNSDFIGLYLQDGTLHYVLRTKAALGNMTSKFKYDDGAWHRVVFNRDNGKAHLIIDDADQEFVELVEETANVPQQALTYVGGVDPSNIEKASANLNYDKRYHFKGCIKGITMNEQTNLHPRNISGVAPCTDQIEPGIFFGKEGGYVKLRQSFKVGSEMTISFDIRPRARTGLLLSVFGRNSHLTIELVDGVIRFSVNNNGAGDIVATFKGEDLNLCDGKWRTIEAIKSQYVISLSVDGFASQPAIGNTSSSSATTTRPLFLGSHPHLLRIRGVSARKPYHGCIKNVRVKSEEVNVTPEMALGHVEVGVCPTV